MFRSVPSRCILAVWVLVLLLASCAAADEGPQYVRLTILHTNDTHGHLLPFSYPDPTSEGSILNELPALKDIGGAARRSTIIEQTRGERGMNLLLLDGGDVTDGTPFSVYYTGTADIEAMNVIGYDAMITGNHEYNMSPEKFRTFVETAQFPIICANARLVENNVPILPTRIVFERGGLRVGVFGLTTLEAQDYPANRDRVRILDLAPIAAQMVSELRRAGADVIIALTHIGYEEDLALAEAVPEIDVIVGGHTHTRLTEPTMVSHGESSAHDINATIVAQAFQWGGELGRLDIVLYREDDGSYNIMTKKGRLIPITCDIPNNTKVAEVIDRLYQPMMPIYGEALGEATGDFVNAGFERATVNLIADFMREATGSDVALQNYGGARESITKGTIRMWEVASVLPFNNKIAVMRMTGKQLCEGLANGEEFLGPSGMTYIWRDDKPSRVEINGAPIEDGRIYSVATTDYIAGKCFGDVKDVTITDMDQRDTIADMIRKKGVVSPALDGRVSEAK